MSPLRIWRVQEYCFPYRSVARGRWDVTWPFWATMPRALDEASREGFYVRTGIDIRVAA